MPKLFVAIGLPASVTEELVAIQPRPAPGIRLVEPDQMHLTLHYIGEMDSGQTESLATRLASVSARPFSLKIEGVGQFPSVGGNTTLWAGIRENPALRKLHGAIAQPLVEEGLRPEARPYQPHIALARCAPEVPLDSRGRPRGGVRAFFQHRSRRRSALPVRTGVSMASGVNWRTR